MYFSSGVFFSLGLFLVRLLLLFDVICCPISITLWTSIFPAWFRDNSVQFLFFLLQLPSILVLVLALVLLPTGVVEEADCFRSCSVCFSWHLTCWLSGPVTELLSGLLWLDVAFSCLLGWGLTYWQTLLSTELLFQLFALTSACGWLLGCFLG